MQADFYSLFAYTFSLGATFVFARASEKSKCNKKELAFFSFLVVFLFCALRYYVGNDYVGYHEIFIGTKYEWDPIKLEPGYYFLCRLFHFSKHGYVYVAATASFIITFLVYKTLIRNDVLSWGFFVFYTLEFMIFANNGVRQGLAIAIVIYSMDFLLQKKYLKYLLGVLIASTFHYTAIIMLLLIFIRRINISYRIYLIVLIAATGLYFSGVLTPIIGKIMFLTPLYGEHYALMHEDQFDIVAVSSGLGFLFKVLVTLFAIISLRKVNHFYIQVFILGSIFRICFTGFLLPDRMTLYLVYTNIVALPMILKHSGDWMLKQGFLAMVILYYILQSLFALENNGAVPYRTLFFEDLDRMHYEYVFDDR